jgi:hypothetical protein
LTTSFHGVWFNSFTFSGLGIVRRREGSQPLIGIEFVKPNTTGFFPVLNISCHAQDNVSEIDGLNTFSHMLLSTGKTISGNTEKRILLAPTRPHDVFPIVKDKRSFVMDQMIPFVSAECSWND